MKAKLKPVDPVAAPAQPAVPMGDAAFEAAFPDLPRDGYAVRVGDACERLTELPEGSVHLAATSPPYFQLRAYATGAEAKAKELGSEKTVGEFVENLVRVGEGVRRALREDGVFFVNLGDTYNTNIGGKYEGDGGTAFGGSRYTEGGTLNRNTPSYVKGTGRGRDPIAKPKSLLGIPWRVAFAMEAAGWYLRKEIIWAKPNPMPESVMDRPTSSHETVFMFTKSTRNFWDKEAVREKGVIAAGTLGAKGSAERQAAPGVNARPPEYKVYDGRRNLRDVWWIQTRPFKGAHFATFPAELVAPMILGGTSAAGVCVACGTPRRRVTELIGVIPTSGHFGSTSSTNNPLAKRFSDIPIHSPRSRDRSSPGNGGHRTSNVSGIPVRETLAWDPGCGPVTNCSRCKGEGIIKIPKNLPTLGPAQGELADEWPEEDSPGLRGKKARAEAERAAKTVREISRATDAMPEGFEDCPRCMGYGELRTGCTSEKPVPALVLDPFLGSGTTVREAVRLARRGVGFDLSDEYLEKYARPSIREAARQPGLLGIG